MQQTDFFVLLPLMDPENQNFEKMKKSLEMSSLYICVLKIMIRWRTVPEMWSVTDVIVISHFGLFLPFYPPKSPKNQKKLEKMKKSNWRYHHFTYVYQKLWSDDVPFLRYGAWWMDEWMDGPTDGQTNGWTDRWTDGKSAN